ncbi:acetyl-CoA sensor PanZ family protein [Endozoicomonas sp. SM1973]|uniref:Acetyl-CoA sensor PanZ family protein n=1 Tax=Spartinivicinus marinus TaxID=2994442 RepID=A0A853I0F4_9GAMM|nr:acetyl-CoA sensor PanZ family protein [Spartinivicinus marinus]NYZ66079.1 acetyl-CoA sensor PanZ family protein [Spartinivicinus marinus]
MPVTVEVLTNISEQDYQDIDKSYQQIVASTLISTSDLPSTFEQFWLGIDKAVFNLYGARFNSRLIGWVLISHAVIEWNVELLCVGLPNQGRGVGERILQVLTKQAAKAGCQLLTDKPIIYFEKHATKI